MFGKKKSKERVKFDRESYKKAKRIFRFMKPYRAWFIVGFLFLILSSVTMMLFPVLMGKLIAIDNPTTGFDFDLNDQLSNNLNNINLIAILLLATFAALAIFSFCTSKGN